MIKKSTVTLILAGIFIFCIIGICRWPYTERLYVSMRPSPYTSAEFEGMSKSDKLLMVSDEDVSNFEYLREGIYPIDYAPNYAWLIVISVGAGASFTAMFSMLVDFYIARKRTTWNAQKREEVL